MDNRTLFTGRSAAYMQGRPAYAGALLEDLLGMGLGAGTAAADVGAGTGIFTRQLAGLGGEVYCVEPNAEMLAAARQTLAGCAGVHFVQGDAAHTGLEDGSVDWVTAAQAFHWFDGEAFRQECRRIGRPGCRVVLVWNTREEDAGINRALAEVYRTYCPRFRGFSGGVIEDDPRIAAFFRGAYEKRTYDHPLTLDREKFISRSLSGSYALTADAPEYPAFVRALHEVFDRYAADGQVQNPNRTVAYFGRVDG